MENKCFFVPKEINSSHIYSKTTSANFPRTSTKSFTTLYNHIIISKRSFCSFINPIDLRNFVTSLVIATGTSSVALPSRIFCVHFKISCQSSSESSDFSTFNTRFSFSTGIGVKWSRGIGIFARRKAIGILVSFNLSG